MKKIFFVIWVNLATLVFWVWPVWGQSGEITHLWEESQQFYERGEYERAIAPLESALNQSITANNPLQQGRTLIYLSLVYQGLGDWEQAQNALNEVEAILPELSGSEVRQRLQGKRAEVQGKLYLTLGQPADAIAAWEEASTSYQQRGDGAGVQRTKVHQAIAFQALGQHRTALKTLLPAVLALQTQPDSLTKAIALRELGNLIRVVGEVEEVPKPTPESDYLDQSEAILKQSLTLSQTLQNPKHQAETLLSLGNTAQARYYQLKDARERVPLKINDPEKQIEFYHQAIQYYQKVLELNTNPLLTIKAQLNHLNLLIEIENRKSDKEIAKLTTNSTNELNKILEKTDFLIETLKQLPQQEDVLKTQLNLAANLIEFHQGKQTVTQPQNLKKINSLLEYIVTTSEKLGLKNLQAQTLYEISRIHEISGNNNQAQAITQKALLLAEQEQSHYITYQLQWQLARLLKKQGKQETAITAYEETIKTLDKVRYDLISLKNPDIRFLFRDSVEPVYRELLELLVTEAPQNVGTKQNTIPALNDLQKAKQYLEKLKVAELEDYLRCQLQSVDSISLNQLIETHDLNSTSIHSIVLEDRLIWLVKSPNSQTLDYYSIDITRRQLENKINTMRTAVNEEEDLGVATIYQELYDLLIKPLEHSLKQSNPETLVFVLDDFLQNLPLAALYDKENGEYLIEKYSIALNLGLELVDEMPLSSPDFNLLIGGLSESVLGLDPLPFVEKEVEYLTRQFSKSIALKNNEFTKQSLQEMINKNPFPIVHLATHGRFSSSPEETYLVTSDQKLNLNDINTVIQRRGETFSQTIELLVLSACQTAVGDRRATLGLAGISVQAGAVSTVASLFNIQDEATVTLMEHFYQQLSEGKSKAEALQQAQIAMLQDPDTQEPYYWAPFVLVGNWR